MLILECEAIYIVWFMCRSLVDRKQHQSICVNLCGGATAIKYIQIDYFSVSHLLDLIKVSSSVVTRQRKYNSPDKHFITNEDTSCRMDYRAQAVVTTHEHHKERIIVDYFQNMNHLTMLVAHSLSRINKLINTVIQYQFFSMID